jgi:hypothetical protein
MCGPGSKICRPERAPELLEAIIEPGDRVAIAGNNQQHVNPTDPFHASSSEESHENKKDRG